MSGRKKVTIKISKENADWLYLRRAALGIGSTNDDALTQIRKELKDD